METKYVRVPFEVELAKEISNGSKEGKIVTRNGRNVRIICWDAKKDDNIIALIGDEWREYLKSYPQDGLIFQTEESNADLFLETPEYLTFKDGDVLTYWPNGDRWCIFIYKNRDKDVLSNYVSYDCDSRGNNILTFGKSFYNSVLCGHSTEAEKTRAN